MRYIFFLVLVACSFSQAWAQPNCLKNSKLYYFDPTRNPRNFTERLGNHPQFPFLQEKNGVNSVAAFITSINNPENQQKYRREFLAFDLLLRNSGFTNGYKDLTDSNVENLFVKRGTIGNLGFYDPQRDLISYIYVKLNPAGEPKTGIPAWKLTTAKGCYLYILHTCGNAFYPNTSPRSAGAGAGKKGAVITGGCKVASIEGVVNPLEIKPDSVERKLHVTINFYQASLTKSKHAKSGYDTVVSLIHHMDTVSSFRDRNGKQLKIYANPIANKILICRDTSLKFYNQLQIDSSGNPTTHEPIDFVLADTVYTEAKKVKGNCKNKVEITIDGGMSVNAIPRFNSATEHSQTNGAQLAGEFSIAQIFAPWIEAGVSASYITLSYQDDFPYPGSVAGTYNKVYLGAPIIPVQLFGKFNFGKEVGFQANLTLSVGYSFPMKGRIENSGNVLTTTPDLQGAPTAGVKMGIAYYFTCKFGLGISAGAQFFSNKGALMNYNLFSLPVVAGLRIRI
ncbi:MAG TPA: hypothetical protein VMH01_14365 [Puia sp.]|nr:hypothetical protein [Puia sp.]